MANPRSMAQIAGHPLHPMLIPFPIAFLTGTLVCDIVYSRTSDPFWAQMAYWLLIAALAMAGLAAIAGFTDFFGDRLIRATNAVCYHMIRNLTAVIVSLIDFWFRYSDGVTADYPKILIISLAVGCYSSSMDGRIGRWFTHTALVFRTAAPERIL